MKSAGIFFLIFILFITGFIKIKSLMAPVDRYNNNNQTTIRINSGSNSREIGIKLYNHGLIKSYIIFNLCVSITGFDEKLQAGYYEFSPSDNMWEIIRDIAEGRVANFKVTIPEGYTVEKIAERLSELTTYKKSDFIEEARNKELINNFINISDSNVKYLVEGFLYPDTYFIPRAFTPFQIYKIMIDNFKRKWWTKLETLTAKKSFNTYEILTIASLIEKEAKLEQEKPVIAGVIYNRLQQDMKLQIDAGVQYSMEERKKIISYDDVKIDSPYNTYLYHDLPPGPICNPGDAAIKAALNPDNVDYLFYFALNDGSHFFTKTYEEHLQMQSLKKEEGLIDKKENEE